MADDNIVRLAALQESGNEIPPNAEDSIALAFAEKYADQLRFVAAWGWWLIFSGARWLRDDTLHVFDSCERSAVKRPWKPKR